MGMNVAQRYMGTFQKGLTKVDPNARNRHSGQRGTGIRSSHQPVPRTITPRAMNLIKRQPDFFDSDLLDLPGRMLGTGFFRDREFPMVNIRNLDKEFKVELAVPGYKKEDLKVAIADGVLTISSEQKMEKESDQDGWKRREFSYNSFSRDFQLPENTDADSVKATFTDGVLNLSIPKKEPETVAARAKTIAIK